MIDVKDIRIADAKFFPKPNAIFREVENFSNGFWKGWTFNGLLVVVSAGVMQDGKEWLHVSFSRKSKMPTYADLQLVKREFIGRDKKAVMVFPEEKNYVNIHPNCLHLWYCEDNPLPEFSGGLGTI